MKVMLVAIFACLCLLAVGCNKPGTPKIFLNEGITLPIVTALAWLDAEDSSGNERFVSAYEDGTLAVWDVCSGLVTVTRSGQDDLYPNAASKDATSPDGAKKVSLADDGSILLADNSTGKELARYYCFGEEWVCMVPEGFYSASFGGAAFLSVEDREQRFGLEQLSGTLFRPDLFRAFVSGEAGDGKKGTGNGANPAPISLEGLFRKNSQPPLVSFSFDADTGEPLIKVTEQKGGAGFLTLYRRNESQEIPREFPVEVPVGLFPIEKVAGKKYSEKGNACYEISLKEIGLAIEAGELGVSAFNKSNTVESRRLWVELPLASSLNDSSVTTVAATLPVLRALIAASDGERGKAVGEILSHQREGALYSSV